LPSFRTKRNEAVRLEYGDEVEARADLQYGRRWIPKGTRLNRSDPAVIADVAGHHFQVPAVPLSKVLETEREVNDGT
jgi:hypothetical protein